MIVKSLSRKTGGYGSLLQYIIRDKAVLKKEGQPFLVIHNAFGKDIKKLEEQFLDNEKRRAHVRKGSVKMYHDIISFRSEDTKYLDECKMEIMIREYIRIRNPDAMYVWALHKDKDHFHAHGIMSGTEIISGKAVRISKADFAAMKEKLQQFQRERYPELTSIVEHGKKNRALKKDSEYQFEKRSGKISQREQIRQTLENIYMQSVSKDEFYENVQKAGFNLYNRGGNVVGISAEKNMRFNTLGLTEERLEELNKTNYKLNELNVIREERPKEAARTEDLEKCRSSIEESDTISTHEDEIIEKTVIKTDAPTRDYL